MSGGPILVCRRRCMPCEQRPLALPMNWPYSGTDFAKLINGNLENRFVQFALASLPNKENKEVAW